MTFLSWNVAKAFAHKSGFRFDTKENVRERLRKMAAVIEVKKPDVVFVKC